MYFNISGSISSLRVKYWYQVFLLAIFILILFAPSISGEISIVDDRLMIDSILNDSSFSLKQIFFPQIYDAGYYRPLIGLSYYLDKELWLLDGRMMHLENVLLHLLNVALVFFLARGVTLREGKDRSLIPLVAAMIFGVHPLATESVNWISGRTDLLAGVFVLSGALMFVKYGCCKRPVYLLPAVVFLLMGVLAKEVALALAIAAPFLMWPREGIVDEGMTLFLHCILFLALFGIAMAGMIFLDNYWLAILSAAAYFVIISIRLARSGDRRRDMVRSAGLISFLFGLGGAGVVFAVVLRRLAFSSDMGKFGRLVELMVTDTNYALSVFLGAAGFYIKKFFVPLPLNFFIREVDPLYDFLGIAVLLGCALLAARRTTIGGVAFAGVCMLVPALPFAFGTIAWTGYAERYAYIASAFWAVALTAWVATLIRPSDRELPKRFAMVLIAVIAVMSMASVTCARNIQWRSNTRILGDTVKKSPKAKTIRIMYAYALFLDKKIPEAKREADIARSLYSLEYDETVDIVSGTILNASGRVSEAESCYEEAVRRTRFRSAHALDSIIRFYEDLLRSNTEDEDRVRNKVLFYADKLAELTKNPYHLYKAGQYFLAQGDSSEAMVRFQKAHDAFSDKEPFKVYSQRIIDRLRSLKQ